MNSSLPAADYAQFVPKPSPLGGRPSNLNPEIVAEICQIIHESGCSDSAAGLLAGVPTSTLARWKQEREDFAFLLQQARAHFDVARLREIAQTRNRDGSLHWRAQAWLLQQSSPETYGPPSRRRRASPATESTAESSPETAASPATGYPEATPSASRRHNWLTCRSVAPEPRRR